jgi:hypothetical protein
VPFVEAYFQKMKTLKGKNIYLRALEPNDLEFIYAIKVIKVYGSK